MDRDKLICHTEGVTDPVTQALAALKRAEALVKQRREELAQAVADAVRNGEKLSHVGKRAGYTPEHVRRIARAHGVKDTTGRQPPPPKRPAASDA